METEVKPGSIEHPDRPDHPDRRRDDAARGAESVSVEIYDQIYHLRGTAQIISIDWLIWSTPRCARSAAQGSTVDSLRVAVLAALNIADELLALRERHVEATGNASAEDSMRTRAGTLSGILDELLEDRRAG